MPLLKKDKKECKCPNCGTACKTKEELETHVSKAHAAKLKCEKCGMTFRAKEKLEAHMAKSHPIQKS